MGIGSIALAIVALTMTGAALTLRTPHEATSVAIMFAISGAAVAHEGKHAEADTSPAQKRMGFWLNVTALLVAASLVATEIVRRTNA